MRDIHKIEFNELSNKLNSLEKTSSKNISTSIECLEKAAALFEDMNMKSHASAINSIIKKLTDK